MILAAAAVHHDGVLYGARWFWYLVGWFAFSVCALWLCRRDIVEAWDTSPSEVLLPGIVLTAFSLVVWWFVAAIAILLGAAYGIGHGVIWVLRRRLIPTSSDIRDTRRNHIRGAK